MSKPYEYYIERLKQEFGELTEGIMEAAGLSAQDNGLIAPAGVVEPYPSNAFSTKEDGELEETMGTYYSRASVDGIAAVKLLVDAENNLLCAVVCKGMGGTSYFYGRREDGKPSEYCTPISIIDLAMTLLDLQQEYTLISWGGLTADFRMMYNKGFAPEEWAVIAANHIDMLYQLRMLSGPKLNLQMACINMGITAVEKNARSFRIEEATSGWKHDKPSSRTHILDSMRAYCKLLLSLYGAVAERGTYTVQQKNSALIEQSPMQINVKWGKVWEAYKDTWAEGKGAGGTVGSEVHASVEVMHGWLVGHANRSKRSLRQLAPPPNSLSDLVKR